MAYYLQMDGVDDRVRMPSMSFDEVILDCYVEHKTATLQYYFDARVGKGNSQVLRNTSNQDAVGNATAFTSLSVDGVTVTFAGVTFTPSVPSNQRTVIRAVYSTTTADDLDVFVDRALTGYLKGRIYNVTMKLSGSTVAFYDMTLGNVQDQSGNGRHATLTGGTWVNESSGTTQEGASSVTGVSTLSASATVIPAAITGSASLQGVATINATADVISPALTGSASLTGVGTVTAAASVIRSASAVLKGVSTLTASAAGLTVLGGASLSGVGWVIASGIEGQFIVSVVNLEFEIMRTVQLESSIERVVNLEALLAKIVALEGEL